MQLAFPKARLRRRRFTGLLAWFLLLLLPGTRVPAAETPSVQSAPTSLARPLNLPGEINDERLETYLDEAADRLIKARQTVKMSELLRQAQRRFVHLELPKPPV